MHRMLSSQQQRGDIDGHGTPFNVLCILRHGEYRIHNTLSYQAFAQSYSLMTSRKRAPVSSGAFASPTITQAL